MGDRAGGGEAMEVEVEAQKQEYSQLKDLKASLNLAGLDHEHGLRLCLWLYLSSCSRFPAPILQQVRADGRDGAPFLALSKDKRIILYPSLCLQEESSSLSPSCSSSSGNSCQSMGRPSILSESECPLSRWVHVGCQVSRSYAHLYINGNLVGEMALSSLNVCGSKILSLVGNSGFEGKLHGYVHAVQHLPKSISIRDHFIWNPPIQLSLDLSCTSDGVEDCSNGIWSIVGGKASCRRNFTLEVILLDAFGRPVHKDMEIFASLVYADNGAPVEKAKDDTEGPLLINSGGIDIPSTEKPVKIVYGRASFRLKISQLSSKCENRLFRVLFQSMDAQRYPFMHAYSPPIQCISRNPKSRTPATLGKKPAPVLRQFGGCHSEAVGDGSQSRADKYEIADLQISDQSFSKFTHSPKRAKLGPQMKTNTPGTFQLRSNGCCSHSLIADDGKDYQTNSEDNSEHLRGTNDLASDSESTDARNPTYERSKDIENLLSDATVFRYCLEGLDERYMLLKEIGHAAAEQELQKFAEHVVLYSGCLHHQCQIIMSKQLVQEGISSWHAISKGNTHALWVDSLPEIIRRFRRISRSSRALTGQDIEVLHRIAGCSESSDDMNRDNFDKLWSWLYPIALTISMEQINDMWESTSPKWIEGLITKEEAENALKFSGGLYEPGTFVLRFPTSRRWPHPDAGSLVVTFVGTDHVIHNKLLSIDPRNRDPTPLTDLLLEEPELMKLARNAAAIDSWKIKITRSSECLREGMSSNFVNALTGSSQCLQEGMSSTFVNAPCFGSNCNCSLTYTFRVVVKSGSFTGKTCRF